MNSLLLLLAIVSADHGNNQFSMQMIDPYGRYRMYSAKDLTVDATPRNRAILKEMRRQEMYRHWKYMRPQREETHNGNGYRWNMWKDDLINRKQQERVK